MSGDFASGVWLEALKFVSTSWNLASVYGRIILHDLWSEGGDGLSRRSRGQMIARRLAALARGKERH